MLVPKKLGQLYVPHVYLGVDPLKWVSEHEYLGVVIRSDYSDDADISRQVQSDYINGNTLLTNFSHCSIPVKSELFKVNCYNMYCIHLWKYYTKIRYKKCKTAYYNIFRRLFYVQQGDSISGSMASLGIDSFDIRRRKVVFKFYERVRKGTNSLIVAIVNSLFFIYESRLFKNWKDCLVLGGRSQF